MKKLNYQMPAEDICPGITDFQQIIFLGSPTTDKSVTHHTKMMVERGIDALALLHAC